VVWWEKGFYEQEDEAVAEIITTFEQDTSKQVELVQPTQDEMFDNAEAALAAGRPPDFLFGTVSERRIAQWAYEDRLVDLRAARAAPGPVRCRRGRGGHAAQSQHGPARPLCAADGPAV
jgi:ABC-type glycerol-3-phosphate transport system substrate-binding protein